MFRIFWNVAIDVPDQARTGQMTSVYGRVQPVVIRVQIQAGKGIYVIPVKPFNRLLMLQMI